MPEITAGGKQGTVEQTGAGKRAASRWRGLICECTTHTKHGFNARCSRQGTLFTAIVAWPGAAGGPDVIAVLLATAAIYCTFLLPQRRRCDVLFAALDGGSLIHHATNPTTSPRVVHPSRALQYSTAHHSPLHLTSAHVCSTLRVDGAPNSASAVGPAAPFRMGMTSTHSLHAKDTAQSSKHPPSSPHHPPPLPFALTNSDAWMRLVLPTSHDAISKRIVLADVVPNGVFRVNLDLFVMPQKRKPLQRLFRVVRFVNFYQVGVRTP
ncbi:hypothetical protein P154DRAFT_620929 [Amniculicola lignicola CBS 123094]|uniref:Uncharacterized protein n=1 Tax=Amniculicola lignicola CBS 123094 TaxID=1392246 RepID=A0A6A5WPH0_9PLEO|nr:hypothetical protein P154DRAFT_620929 [Amniculicola lignicola CBS 123094]